MKHLNFILKQRKYYRMVILIYGNLDRIRLNWKIEFIEQIQVIGCSRKIVVLGLTWDKLADTIIINFKDIRLRFVEKPNKRSMLQSIASIYDPLSLICPITVKMKNLFQDVCTSKIAWDEDLPDEYMLRWQHILQELGEVDCLIIPRQYCFISGVENAVKVQLHSSSDASERNIAPVFYLRFEFIGGETKCSIANSKSRVLSQTRKLTIPRAELLGALLMAEQSSIVFQVLKSVYNIKDCYYWIDSAVVYSWILNKTKKYDALTKDYKQLDLL